MLPLDPKEAANLGKAWGETITDSVFGIADDMKKVKAKNIATKARNELVQINNDIAKNNALLRKQAMQEIASEQERDRIAKMNPAQREAYKKAKARAALDAHNREIEAENTKQVVMAVVILVVLICVAGGVAALMLMK